METLFLCLSPQRMNRKHKQGTSAVQMKDSSEGSSESQVVADGQNISSILHDPSLENGLNEICLVPNSKDMYESSEQVIKASFGHQKVCPVYWPLHSSQRGRNRLLGRLVNTCNQLYWMFVLRVQTAMGY